MKFVLQFINNTTRKLEVHPFNANTHGYACLVAQGIVKGKDIQDFQMREKEEEPIMLPLDRSDVNRSPWRNR